MIAQALGALTLSTVGIAAAATDSMGGGSIAPYVQGGGSAAAVAGLVYVARMVIKGDLVPRPIRDQQAEMTAAIRTTAEREQRLQEIAGESHAREITLSRLQGETTKVLAQLEAEMRYWRDQRQNRPTR